MNVEFISAEKPEIAPPLLQDGEVDQFLSRRVCSRCYADLEKRPVNNPRGWQVFCYFCGDVWGYTTISRRYAEILGQTALADHRQARTRFADIVPDPLAGKTQSEILSELGY